MEWLPLYRGSVPIGVLDLTSITRVVEWGNLARFFVAIDSTFTPRSGTLALGSAFAGYAYGKTNFTAYYDSGSSEERHAFEYIAAQLTPQCGTHTP